MHKPAHRPSISATHNSILTACAWLAEGCLSWLSAVKAALVPLSGYFAKRAYYLQQWRSVGEPGIGFSRGG